MRQAWRSLCVAVALAAASTVSMAAPVLLTWQSTVSSVGDDLPTGVALGDPFSFVLKVDNGGASLLSQTWAIADLISATINVNGGAYTATFTGGATGSGSFQTNAAGNVSAVGNWRAFPAVAFFDSLGNDETNSGNGGWFINGLNQVSGIFDPNSPSASALIAISSPTVAGNQDAANWTATVAATVPEPGTLALLGLGLAGLAASRRRKQ